MVVYVGVRFEHTLGASRALVGSDAALLGVLSQWCAGAAERQRPHSISTWCDETEIRSRSDPVSSFDVHRAVEP